MGGSMGSVVGAKFVRAVDEAIANNCALICFSASGVISVLTDPTMGGVSASLAMLGDINIGEPKALIGFAGQRVIEQTVREKLPEGFQRSEFLLEHGAIDMIVDRREMRERVAGLVAKLTNQPALDSQNHQPELTAEEEAVIKEDEQTAY